MAEQPGGATTPVVAPPLAFTGAIPELRSIKTERSSLPGWAGRLLWVCILIIHWIRDKHGQPSRSFPRMTSNEPHWQRMRSMEAPGLDEHTGSGRSCHNLFRFCFLILMMVQKPGMQSSRSIILRPEVQVER